MKVIDLLNNIANEEDLPKYIKVYDDIYEYDVFNKLYWNSNNKQLLDVYNGKILNYEVEIIEEEKKIPENNFNYIYSCEDEHIMANFENIKTTLKDIIDYLKSKGE